MTHQLSFVCNHIGPTFKGKIIILDQYEPTEDDTGLWLSCADCKKFIDAKPDNYKDLTKWKRICNDCTFGIKQ